MPFLILARHGNTFESNQTPTWVGAKSDFPLTEKGEAQGQAMAGMIMRDYMPINSIITGPLIRTKRFAEVLSEKTNVDFSIDDRLCEIDYGLWENKSSDEIKELYDPSLLAGWENRGIWPEGMEWAPSKEKLLDNIQSLLKEEHKELLSERESNHALFTSNGILRFVYNHLTGRPPSPEAKVKPGNYCVLEPTDTGWKILKWNEKPS